MGVILNTNTASIFATKALESATRMNNSTVAKLATGKRINRGADDAAGLSINEKLNTKLRGITKAEGNIGDALAVIDRTYSGLNYIMDNLQKVRELWVKAENGTNGIDELDAIQRDMNGYVSAIQRVRNGGIGITSYDGQGNEVFHGISATKFFQKDFQVGTSEGDVISLDFSDNVTADNSIDTSVGPSALATLSKGASFSLWQQYVGGTVNSLSGPAGAKRGGIDDIDLMIKNLSRMMSVTDKYHARFTAAYDKLQEEKYSYSAFQSQVLDTDYAETSSAYVKDQVRSRSAASVLTQANAQVGFALNLLP
jgi:flagellin